MSTLLLFASVLVLSLVLQAIFLWIGARWLKASKATIGKAFLATSLMLVVSMVLLAISVWLPREVSASNLSLTLVDLAVASAASMGFFLAQILIHTLIIKWIMQTPIWRAFSTWLASLIPSVAMLAFTFLVIRPYMLEAFVIPTFAMAPTLVGWHKNATCPHCGQTLLIPNPDPEEMSRPGEPNPLGICSHCFQASRSDAPSLDIVTADRIIANKLLSPRRWDIIVFRFPRDPSVKYAMRLVGLPGEKMFIKDGAVWANDVRFSPPESLANLHYSTELESGAIATFGSEERPWILKEDEFCVLGDFSDRSSDSRFWGPVPRSNIEGVVSIRYWPISRWKVWR